MTTHTHACMRVSTHETETSNCDNLSARACKLNGHFYEYTK